MSWALFLLWAAAVWFISARSHPASDLDWPWEVPDKLAHGVEYALGGFLARQAFSRSALHASASSAALVICAAWGAIDEVHQGFVPYRMTDPWDLAADVIGVAAGVLTHAVVIAYVTRVLWARADRGSR